MTIRNLCLKGLLVAAPLGGMTSAMAQGITGPSSSQSPYVLPTGPGIVTVSLLTVGDAVNYKPDGVTPYRMVGIPDGLGAYDNGDGTFTLLMNQEIAGNGIVRAHGRRSAFVSQWTIDKFTLQVLEGHDFIQDTNSIFLSNNSPNNDPALGVPHSGYEAGGTTTFNRFCSADLAAPTAYLWTDPSSGITYGTPARIFQSGEENGFARQFAFIATDDPNTDGNDANTAYEIPHCGLFSWENNVASPYAQRKTIVMGMDDTTPGQVYVWVGDKQTSGNVVERAGLTRQGPNDNLYVVKVSGLGTNAAGATLELRATPANGTFTLENEGDVSGLTGTQLENLSNSKGGTLFLRPEDGSWDPSNPSDYYFVTTDRYDQVKDGVGTTIGRSRLYRLRFTDISQPELGGTIEAVLDGTEAGNMYDNITVDKRGNVLLQEDVGGQDHLGKIFSYNIATDTLTLVATHDPARFIPGMSDFLTRDEESSGIIPMEDILGAGWYLFDVQAHYDIGDPELVEGGQLNAIHIAPGKIPGVPPGKGKPN